MRTDSSLSALRDGKAFVDLSEWRKVLVRGTEAAAWLNDLLSAELEGLAVGGARRSLLLSPTGRIRADLTVARLEDGFLLVQDPRQPGAIDRLLDPYVLSSDVRLDDRTEELALFAFPGSEPPPMDSVQVYRPSSLGEGADAVAASGNRESLRAGVELVEAGPEAVEAWRIERGAVRFGADLGEDSLPHGRRLRQGLLPGPGSRGQGAQPGPAAVRRPRRPVGRGRGNRRPRGFGWGRGRPSDQRNPGRVRPHRPGQVGGAGRRASDGFGRIDPGRRVSVELTSSGDRRSFGARSRTSGWFASERRRSSSAGRPASGPVTAASGEARLSVERAGGARAPRRPPRRPEDGASPAGSQGRSGG
jgi:hypothetical protein